MIDSPVVIIGCARSGTTLLYSILSEIPTLWSIGAESKAIIETYHSPAVKDWESGALAAEDLTSESRHYILREFENQAIPGTYWQRINKLRQAANRWEFYGTVKRRGRTGEKASGVASAIPGGGLESARTLGRVWKRLNSPPGPVRLLEKTPENCLRLPFMKALFPDARIIFLTRDGRANVHSLMEGWRQPHLFPGYRTPIAVNSPGQTRGRWAFTLIPGWRELVNRPVEEICAHQWAVCNETVIAYMNAPDTLPVLPVRYEDLVLAPDETMRQLATFLGLQPADIPAYKRGLPEVNVVSSPDFNKWRRESETIERIAPVIAPVMAKLGYSDPALDSTSS